mmetsp:Transcript_8383/g.25318  ORF Transcript_8383/g.25318 Transcript_8383/m.25318 type:complete len:428 (-) Transcript_8383:263-1546(-)
MDVPPAGAGGGHGQNMFIIGGTVVGGVVMACAAGPAVVPVIAAAGFTEGGIIAGSWAAWFMSSTAAASGGAVTAGSACAILQSIGATGALSGGMAAAVAAGGAGIGAGIGAGVGAFLQRFRRRTPVVELAGLSALRPYRAVLLSDFGVLHDGQARYSERTVEAVQCLASAGVRIYIISNSSQRSNNTIANLTELGFDPAWFEGAVTSGDMAYEHLLHRPDEWWRSLGSRCVHFTWSSRGTINLEGLSLQVTSNISDADFILVDGTEAVGQGDGPAVETPLHIMRAMLAVASAKKLPMIVVNPDVVRVNGPGGPIPMPGLLAKWYGEMGGTATLMGKPAPAIYEAAMSALDLSPKDVIAIGDSLEHDIAGAAAAGIDSLLIAGGIHAADLGVEPGARQGPVNVDRGALAQLCERHHASPTYVAGFLEW